MENSNQLDELLVNYLIGELNREEESFVINWINTNEENLLYFEALKNTWHLTAVKLAADHINVDAEWNQFRQTIASNEIKVVSINEIEGQPSGDEYIDEETENRRPFIYRMMIAVAVAASVLLVIGLGWKLFTNQKQETSVAQEMKKTSGELLATIRHEVNTSGKAKTFLLEDGSQIVLWDKSEISFEQPFASDKRHIILKGKADFKVAKDKSKPFTVFSGDISTTALGTEFTVTAFVHAANITVRLYEGKVLIKSIDSASKKLKKDFYLLPGQELIYDNNRATARVRMFGSSNAPAKEEVINETASDDPTVPKNTGNWYMFNNQSLDQVFSQLEEMYNAEIIYSRKDVQRMYFIGKFEKSDSLENILNQIATLNNLTVVREENKYVIEKEK